MKKQNGVTLVALTITIVVLLILTFTISMKIPDISNRKKKSNFENDMRELKEEIDQYYAKYEQLPIINKYTKIDMLNDIKNVNDDENYYVIDLSKIFTNLNYGKDYEKVKTKDTSEEIAEILDVYIINEQSHTIYYPKGIEYDGEIHYTLDTYTTKNKINTYIKVDLEMENVDTKSVKLIAKGTKIGGDKEIDDYNFYINDTLEKTIKTTDETASYNFNTTFGEYTAYVEVKDTEGNIYKSSKINYSDYSIETNEEGNIKEGVLTIGDYVDYDHIKGTTVKSYKSEKANNGYEEQEYKLENYTEGWRVLGTNDQKQILLISEKPIGNLTLKGQEGYSNGVNELDSISNIYGKGMYAQNAKSITVEDINKITGYNSDITIWDKGQIDEYGNKVTYSKNTDKIYYQGTKFPKDLTESTRTAFTYYTGNEWKTLANGESTTIESTYYYYYPDTLTISSNGEKLGISTSGLSYNMLFKDTSINIYWLASTFNRAFDGYGHNGLRFVSEGYVRGQNLKYTTGGTTTATYGVRPVVTLQSNIKLTLTGRRRKKQ